MGPPGKRSRFRVWLTVTLAVCFAPGADSPTTNTIQAAPMLGGDPPTREPQEGPGKSPGKKPDKKKRSGKRRSKKKGGKKADMSNVPPDVEAETEASEQLGEAFKLERTRHYSILYNTSKEDVKTFGIAIEQTFRSCVNYCLKLDIEVKQPEKKLLIYYFEDHRDFSGHSEEIGRGRRPRSQAGVFFTDLNFSMFFNFRNVDQLKRPREQAEAKIRELGRRLRRGKLSTQQRKNIQRQIAGLRRQANRNNVIGGDLSESTVQHEVAHQVLWNIGFHNAKRFVANPRWFAEGTAMMFEPISDGRSANFGAVNQIRLRDFQGLLSSGRLIPVRGLVSSPTYFSQKTMGLAYAESWALVHYLNRAKRKHIKKYVAAINERPQDYVPSLEDEIAAFEDAFGTLDEKWVRRWLTWMKKVR